MAKNTVTYLGKNYNFKIVYEFSNGCVLDLFLKNKKVHQNICVSKNRLP